MQPHKSHSSFHPNYSQLFVSDYSVFIQLILSLTAAMVLRSPCKTRSSCHALLAIFLLLTAIPSQARQLSQVDSCTKNTAAVVEAQNAVASAVTEAFAQCTQEACPCTSPAEASARKVATAVAKGLVSLLTCLLPNPGCRNSARLSDCVFSAARALSDTWAQAASRLCGPTNTNATLTAAKAVNDNFYAAASRAIASLSGSGDDARSLENALAQVRFLCLNFQTRTWQRRNTRKRNLSKRGKESYYLPSSFDPVYCSSCSKRNKRCFRCMHMRYKWQDWWWWRWWSWWSWWWWWRYPAATLPLSTGSRCWIISKSKELRYYFRENLYHPV
jgi:hypothetical protein